MQADLSYLIIMSRRVLNIFVAELVSPIVSCDEILQNCTFDLQQYLFCIFDPLVVPISSLVSHCKQYGNMGTRGYYLAIR